MKYKLLLIVGIVFTIANTYSQERLIDLYENVVLYDKAPQKRTKQRDEALTLPFFDDFSGTKYYPDQNKWLNDNVYINNGFAIGPPTIGVATFDAVSGDGTHYANASSDPFPSDTLASMPIDLENVDQESVYLSFYYQPQGKGNIPEKNDSLLLQFKNDTNAWITEWRVTGESFIDFRRNKLGLDDNYVTDTLEFLLVNLHINNARYLHDGFQFRFVNYASISGAGDPSRATNCDHWNIDYVYLNEGRSADDVVFEDLAFVEEPAFFMRTYKSVPWSHYPNIIENELTRMTLHVRNNNSNDMSISPATIYFSDLNSSWNDSVGLGARDIDAFSNDRGLFWQFSGDGPIPHSRERGDFLIKAKLYTSSTDPQVNNTVSYEQHFSNYYAYDDGSAEKIYGHNTNGGMVAYKFVNVKGDSLRGADMYFLRNKSQEQAAESFVLCVWNEDNEEPGSIIRSEAGKKLDFGESVNDYVSVTLDTAVYIEAGKTYYIGWQQVSDRYLNVGFDLNNNHKDKIFYNIFGTWENTDFMGALMIRPLFGDPLATNVKEPAKVLDFKVYPNPANAHIKIDIPNLAQSACKIQIFNIMGELVLQEVNYDQNIDVSGLSQGIYFVNVKNGMQQYKAQRLIISE